MRQWHRKMNMPGAGQAVQNLGREKLLVQMTVDTYMREEGAVFPGRDAQCGSCWPADLPQTSGCHSIGSEPPFEPGGILLADYANEIHGPAEPGEPGSGGCGTPTDLA